MARRVAFGGVSLKNPPVPRRRATFTEADVSRAIRAATKAGDRKWMVEIEGDIIRIVPFEGKHASKPKAEFDKPTLVFCWGGSGLGTAEGRVRAGYERRERRGLGKTRRITKRDRRAFGAIYTAC